MDVLGGRVASVEPEMDDFGQEVLVASGGMDMPGRGLGEGKTLSVDTGLVTLALAGVAVLS